MPLSSNSSEELKAGLVDFHRPAYRDWRWLETCWFSAFLPERGMRLHVRAAFRTNLDVAHTMVALYSRSGGVLDMDFYDSQMHQPIGSNRYSNFTLPSGLSLRGRPAAGRYEVRYESRCGRLYVDLDCRARMDPVDLAFTEIDDTATGFAAFHAKRHSEVSIGHVDQTFHVTGSLTLDGELLKVDCISNHDHSWSPRAEYRSGCGTFDEFHFGRDLTLLAQTVQRDSDTVVVTHGYALCGNEVRRLASAKVTYDQTAYETRTLTYQVVDEAGERYDIRGHVRASVVQDQGSNGLTVMNLCEARCNGISGVAESMWHWDIPEMQRRIREQRRIVADGSLSAARALADHLKKNPST